MSQEFDAIFFDLGETLRILHRDAAYEADARRKIAVMLGWTGDPEALGRILDKRYEVYRKWAFDNMAETAEVELWTRWMAYDFPRERVILNAVDLSFQYRQSKGFRLLVRHGYETITELHRRGYKLGIISNLITTREVPDWLIADRLAQYFDAVVLSAVCRIRKPSPDIYLLGAEQIQVDPARCAYIGDNFNRDVTGSKAAGFGLNVIYTNPEKLEKQLKTVSDANRPDGLVYDFLELLDVFPGAPCFNPDAMRPI